MDALRHNMFIQVKHVYTSIACLNKYSMFIQVQKYFSKIKSHGVYHNFIYLSISIKQLF